MKCAIVVLALTGLAAASPEADPQVIITSPALPYAASALPYAASALPYAASPALYNPYLYASRPVAYTAPVAYSSPITYAAAPALVPETPVTSVSSIAPISPFRKAGDCVTAEGCAVRDLIDAGLTGRRVARSAEAEADPQFLSGLPFAAAPYTAAAVSPYAGIYNPYIQAPFYNNLAYNYNLGYANAAPLLNYAAAPVHVGAPAVQTVVKAAPVVSAPVVVKAAPVVHQTVVKAAPAPVVVKAAPVVAAPLPVVRQPVVETKTKKVTYTHIGAHPVHPTDVFETEQRVLY